MRLFRLSRTVHAGDLTGEGARRAGGRWNRKGTAAIYTADSIALATLELLVHLPLAIVPKDFALATFDLPDDLSVETISGETLATDWRSYPAPPALAGLGTAWATSIRTVALRVPSAVTPVGESWNILLNPLHPDFRKITLLEIMPYDFDERLFRLPSPCATNSRCASSP